MIIKLYKILGNNYIFKSTFIILVIITSFILELINLSTLIPMLSFISGLDSMEQITNSYPFLKQILDLKIFTFFKDTLFGEYNFKFFLILFLFIYVIKSLFILLINYLIANFSFSIKKDVSSGLFYEYLNKNYKFHLNKNSAELLNNVTNLVDRLSLSVMAFLTIFSELIIVLAVFIVLILIKKEETLYLSLILIFFSILYFVILKKRIIKWGNLNNILESERIKTVQESFGNIKEILIGSKQSFFSKIYNRLVKENVKINILFTVLNATPRLYLELILVIVIALSVLSKDAFVLNSEIFIFLSMIVIGFLRALPSFNKILSNAQYLSFAKKSIDVIFKDYFNEKEITKKSNKKIKFENNITLKNICFSYFGIEKKILNNLNEKIKFKNFVLISGPSGSGKSTFVNLICGLIEQNSGDFLIDGKKLDDNKSSWQKQIGYVPQQILLLDDTIPKNISLCPETDIDYKKIEKIISMVELNKVYERFGKIEKIGERGNKLSGGQIQRLGIARALYNTPSLLILDESTNSLDNSTELKILNTLKKFKSTMTILFISHKKYDLDFFDQQIIINN